MTATTIYRDRCGIVCQDLDLPDRLDGRAAAWLLIVPGRCVVLRATDPWMTWTTEGMQNLAWRIAGRVPAVLDDLPPGLADELAQALLTVLDLVGAS